MNNIITVYRSKLTNQKCCKPSLHQYSGPPATSGILAICKYLLAKGRRAPHSTSGMARQTLKRTTSSALFGICFKYFVRMEGIHHFACGMAHQKPEDDN
ncbi:Hypothetical protein FKW44_001616 [Caligus rogercresseyi]|uniref:Uncharacterized protein n=1 Tax=Caligus rogercresseyi TaxID=217165 RepID=A0A7T8KIZ3_CALRO|nr:Hypothetical protein FKW44_001616 [Caligus rogercresseyi]